ncbi:MAG: hypothetical protein Q8943_17385 [Bacteroidota bacterium]|nr:hypothetical protein [Bacteroidota bacterium]
MIKDILLTNPQKALVAAAQKANKKLRMHMYGANIEAELPTIDGFESNSLRELRIRYTRSNKDLMSRMGRPVDKLFSATGGSIYYNLPDAQEAKARKLASDVRNGFALKKWIESYWTPHVKDDPNGMILMEVQNGVTYPTYKASSGYYDYLPKGSGLDYVVFKTTAQDKKAAGIDQSWIVYRVIDDAFDYYVRWQDAEATILWSNTFVNLFGVVPAILNSDIVDPDNDGCVLSIFSEIVDLAQEFLVKGSIKITSDFMHAFPKYWEYADDCTECGGSGFKDSDPCPACKGTAKRGMVRVSDIKLLAWPDKDNPAVTPDVAGYVEPSKIYYEIAVQDMADLEDAMTYTIWGSHKADRTQVEGQPVTATQAFIDTQPVNDRLAHISAMAEKRHKFVLDKIIQFNIAETYAGSSVNYGKRFIVESPDVIWNKYSDARESGASPEVLRDLLTEYYEAKYSSDPVKLAIVLKLMDVEPFVHNTILEVQEFKPADEDWKAKLYFSQWRATLNDAMILSFSVETLVQMLYEATATKDVTLAPPAPVIPTPDSSNKAA